MKKWYTVKPDNSNSDNLKCPLIHINSNLGYIAISVAPITQFTHMRNKNSNTQESSPYVVKVIFHTLRNCS